MMGELGAQLAFLGNFHPIVVHFPLALVPIALLMKLWGWWRHAPVLAEAGHTLLKLGLLFALLAATLGMINANANGFSGNQIATHASFAWSTIAVLAFALLLPAQPTKTATAIGKGMAAIGGALLAGIARIGWLLKWLLMIVLFPVTLAYLLLRKLYRWTLARRLNPLLAALFQRLKLITLRLWHWLAGFSSYRNWKNLSYAAVLLLIFMTGLEGGNLVHGKGHLAKNAPDWAAGLLGAQAQDIEAADFNAAFFDSDVAPILRKNCMKCHGEDKAKGGLRLHSIESMVQSGVVRPGAPLDSEMIRRVMLSRNDPGAMPPSKNGRGLNAEEIAVLLSWINGEAVAEGGGGEHGPVAPRAYIALGKSLSPLSDKEVQALNIRHAAVTRLQESLPLLGVNLQFVDEADLPAVTRVLLPVADHIAELDVSGQTLTPDLRRLIAHMNNIVRLNLSRTLADDRLVEQISERQHLRWLNLYGTAITEQSRPRLDALPQLEALYLGGTSLEPEVITREAEAPDVAQASES